ncbi:MAG: hypothetical protein J0H43_16340, partial [Actinobacteria bacterium]|nr:hypothetical protein [Actinomycetota bacterium]
MEQAANESEAANPRTVRLRAQGLGSELRWEVMRIGRPFDLERKRCGLVSWPLTAHLAGRHRRD